MAKRTKSKSRSKDNILTDLYNLNLTGDPKIDKNAILDFFRKYDPNITKYMTAKDVKGIKDAVELAGSLGHYEQIIGKSWFDTDDVKDFYELYDLAREIVDTIIEGKLITKWQLIRVEKLLENVKPSLSIKDKKTKERTSIPWIPDKIDPSEYELSEGMKLIAQRISNKGGVIEFKLNLALIKYNLFNAILPFVNSKYIIRKCLADDCQKAFVINTLRQCYCSAKCKYRIAKRRERERQKQASV